MDNRRWNEANIVITFPGGLTIEYSGLINFWEETRYEQTTWTLEGMRHFTGSFTALRRKENDECLKKN